MAQHAIARRQVELIEEPEGGRQDEGLQPRVGANRWIGSEGVVLQAIDPHSGSGMVRILNEEWRATASQAIATGTTIVVTDVKGTRLFVEELES